MGSGTIIASASVSRSPIRDIIDRSLAGERLTEAETIALIECPEDDLGGLLDAAARVLERPVRGREPEHDEDEDPDVPGERPVRVSGENGDGVHSSSLPTR